MAKRRDYLLNEEQLAELEHAIQHDKRPEVRQRGLAIRQFHVGRKAEEIAATHGVSKPTVYSWWDRWCAGGVAGLANRPKSGRPPKWDAAYLALLEQVIEQEPAELGYRFAVWTLDRLRLHLAQETGVALSEPALRGLLKARGYRYRRPKHALDHLQDPAAKAEADDLLDALKKRSSQTISHSSLWTKRR